MTLVSTNNQPARADARTRPGRLRRVLLISLMCMAVAIAVDFLVFAWRVTDPADGVGRADAIVALTGGPERIDEAMRILDAGSASRLLISGVNTRTSRKALRDLYPQHAKLFACCIDIGYRALDTRGNAAETERWTRAFGYQSLIVVTSAYHMPRSLAELRRAMPNVTFVAHSVQSPGVKAHGWWSDLASIRLLALEYLKFVFARLPTDLFHQASPTIKTASRGSSDRL